jgi:hypothetical protein
MPRLPVAAEAEPQVIYRVAAARVFRRRPTAIELRLRTLALVMSRRYRLGWHHDQIS